jgi:hypothetical protein
VFTKNRHRLREADIARKFLVDIMEHSELRALLSDDALLGRRGEDCVGLNEELRKERLRLIHLAWAAMASAILMARGPPTPCMPGVRIRGAAHQRGRGKDASSGLSVENRSRLIAAATGAAKREAAEAMIARHSPVVASPLAPTRAMMRRRAGFIFFRRQRSNQAIY